MELILVRHAEPVRLEGAAGPADPPLHERGRAQAAALAGWLPDDQVDLLVQSPSRRAIETAAPLADRFGLQPVNLADLVEYEWGSTSYIPYEELRAARDHRFEALARGEPWEQAVDVNGFRQRAVGAIESIIEENPGRRVIIVCHAGVINAYIGHILGIAKLLWFYPQYASVQRVGASRGGDRNVLTLNETPDHRARIVTTLPTPAAVAAPASP